MCQVYYYPNWGVGYGNTGVSISMDQSCKVQGFQAVYGPSVFKTGGTLTVDRAKLYTMKQAIDWVGDRISSGILALQNIAYGGH